MSDKEMKSEATNGEADTLNDKKSDTSTPKKRIRRATLDPATARPYDIIKALKRQKTGLIEKMKERHV